jgi:hypothetical protein
MKRTVQVNVKMTQDDFDLLSKSIGQTLAGRSDDQFWNSTCPSENCCPRHAHQEEPLISSRGCFNKLVILESHKTQLARPKNQSLAVSSLAGIFESLRAA